MHFFGGSVIPPGLLGFFWQQSNGHMTGAYFFFTENEIIPNKFGLLFYGSISILESFIAKMDPISVHKGNLQR
ncbi:hypothetical protein FRX31_006678 [Thalictrum thalictroides]|uniref:Uncharacterized protein n=1 Tax=Thalictrum thalictroides TaxID=46969 RepID=A0A7J6X311_THATH|nr:hypothetical protein FRX31_006678 [Thalictrum thalictroides]